MAGTMVLGPVVFGLVLVFMNELLAVRALGGLLMLAASPVLELQRVNLSPYTVVLAVMAYVWVVAGMVLMLSPYRFRQACELVFETEAVAAVAGVVGIALGGVLVVLGAVAF